MSQEFFVGIERPVEVRRNLLESSRSILQGLQAYEDLTQIRTQKAQITILYHNQVKEIQSAVRKLRKALPKVPSEQIERESTDDKVRTRAIERELDSIEEELGMLKREE